MKQLCKGPVLALPILLCAASVIVPLSAATAPPAQALGLGDIAGAAKKIGGAVKGAAKTVAKDVKNTSKIIGENAKDWGTSVGAAAKDVGRGTRWVGKRVGGSVRMMREDAIIAGKYLGGKLFDLGIELNRPGVAISPGYRPQPGKGSSFANKRLSRSGQVPAKPTKTLNRRLSPALNQRFSGGFNCEHHGRPQCTTLKEPRRKSPVNVGKRPRGESKLPPPRTRDRKVTPSRVKASKRPIARDRSVWGRPVGTKVKRNNRNTVAKRGSKPNRRSLGRQRRKTSIVKVRAIRPARANQSRSKRNRVSSRRQLNSRNQRRTRR